MGVLKTPSATKQTENKRKKMNKTEVVKGAPCLIFLNSQWINCCKLFVNSSLNFVYNSAHLCEPGKNSFVTARFALFSVFKSVTYPFILLIFCGQET